jgi:uncharacterized coiled-coil protein SlyX
VSEDHRQRRRASDEAIDDLNRQVHDYCQQAEKARAVMMTMLDEHGKDIKKHGAQIECLAQGFKKFEPQLKEAMERRKWWSKFWEERRSELITYGVKGSFITLVGLVVYALAGKFTEFVRKALATVA